MSSNYTVTSPLFFEVVASYSECGAVAQSHHICWAYGDLSLDTFLCVNQLG